MSRSKGPKGRFRWQRPQVDLEVTNLLRDALGVHPTTARCLVQRGLVDPSAARHFLDPRLKDLSDPNDLPQMAQAVDRLEKARRLNEKLVLFGDYDVDGVSSVALLTEVLKTLGWAPETYLPHRMEDGYGLSQIAAEKCVSQFQPTIILAVDCGSTANETIAWLGKNGIDVIVVDHHQTSNPPPPAVAIVNPYLHRPSIDPPSPMRPPLGELCSVGLSFKLAHALVKHGRQVGRPEAIACDIRQWLDFVALGTIADLVPLRGESRVLAIAGLERLHNSSRPGVQALKRISGCEGPVSATQVGFQLAPRLNASGRLQNAEESLRLLLTDDRAEADRIATLLDHQNRDRQAIEQSILDQVIDRVRQRFDPDKDWVIVEGELHWHIGVVGIVAARVMREFHRPTIILGGESDEWRGSGRSIAGFDLAAALRDCQHLLIKHGGHAMAAGLSIQPDQVQSLRAALTELARKSLSPEQLIREIRIDTEVALSDLTLELLIEWEKFNPTGQENPPLQLEISGVRLEGEIFWMGKEKNHAKMILNDAHNPKGPSVEAVWWQAPKDDLPSGTFKIVATPSINEFRGRKSVQLKVLDWSPDEGTVHSRNRSLLK